MPRRSGRWRASRLNVVWPVSCRFHRRLGRRVESVMQAIKVARIARIGGLGKVVLWLLHELIGSLPENFKRLLHFLHPAHFDTVGCGGLWQGDAPEPKPPLRLLEGGGPRSVSSPSLDSLRGDGNAAGIERGLRHHRRRLETVSSLVECETAIQAADRLRIGGGADLPKNNPVEGICAH